MGDRCALNEHNWQYVGVRYRLGHRIAGSSAREVEYFDCYFCTRCRRREYTKLKLVHDSYQSVQHEATPMEADRG